MTVDQQRRAPTKGIALWAVADQGVVSAGNFVVTIAVARSVPPIELGTFGILLGVLLTANVAHGSLIGVPLLVLGGGGSRERQDLPGVALLLTVLSLVAYLVALIVVLALVGQPRLLPYVALALCAGQVQETLRRTLMSRTQFRRALWGDAVSYLGQAGAVVVMAGTGHLTLARAFAAMGISSLLALALQWRQARPQLSAAPSRRHAVSPFWRLGRGLLLVNAAGVITIHGVPWLLGALRGLATVGSYQALLTVLSVTNPLMMAANSLVTTLARPEIGSDGAVHRSSALGVARRYGLIVGAVVAAYAVFVLVVPGRAITLFLGAASPYRHLETDLRVMVWSSLALYGYFVLAGVLAARQDIGAMLRAQLTAAVSLALIGVPLIRAAGLRGAVLAAVLTSVARFVVANRAVIGTDELGDSTSLEREDGFERDHQPEALHVAPARGALPRPAEASPHSERLR